MERTWGGEWDYRLRILKPQLWQRSQLPNCHQEPRLSICRGINGLCSKMMGGIRECGKVMQCDKMTAKAHIVIGNGRL